MHVSPQRYSKVAVGGTGACGITATVTGSAGEQVKQACVDASGTVHVATATLGRAGSLEFEL